MESAAAMQSIRLMSGYMEGPYTHASSPSGTFKTQDGWIQIIIVKNHEFEKFCNALGWLDFINDERFSSNAERRKHESFLTKEVQKVFINKPTKYWKKLLNEFQVQNEKVQDYKEFVESEQAQALKLISWLKQPTTDVLWPTPNLPGMTPLDQKGNFGVAPYLGQHTTEVMLELGYDDQKIADFYKDKIIF